MKVHQSIVANFIGTGLAIIGVRLLWWALTGEVH